MTFPTSHIDRRDTELKGVAVGVQGKRGWTSCFLSLVGLGLDIFADTIPPKIKSGKSGERQSQLFLQFPCCHSLVPLIHPPSHGSQRLGLTKFLRCDTGSAVWSSKETQNEPHWKGIISRACSRDFLLPGSCVCCYFCRKHSEKWTEGRILGSMLEYWNRRATAKTNIFIWNENWPWRVTPTSEQRFSTPVFLMESTPLRNQLTPWA